MRQLCTIEKIAFKMDQTPSEVYPSFNMAKLAKFFAVLVRRKCVSPN